VALQPLADRLAELLRQRDCLHADETPVRQLDPGTGTTRHAYRHPLPAPQKNLRHSPWISVDDQNIIEKELSERMRCESPKLSSSSCAKLFGRFAGVGVCVENGMLRRFGFP
jgi:transposase